MLRIPSHLHFSISLIFLLLLVSVSNILSQCDRYHDEQLSPKIANYTITAELDREQHQANCKQTVTWTNTSPNAIAELRFYMYMNAFKNRKSTYLRGVRNFFGENIENRPPSEFGHITISKITRGISDLTANAHYIQPNDGNTHDETVLSLQLDEVIPPGESITLDMEFVSKLPKTFVRAGYGKNDFHLFVHWFPQLGVYEQDIDGAWGWNCHQFMQKTEFFADFGNYDVTVITDDDFIVGGTGCRMSEVVHQGMKTTRFIAYDVIDFGWTAYPLYEVYTDTYEGTDIELLIPEEHCFMVDDYIGIIKKSIQYMEEHVGKYHYPKITIVDPPVHTMRSGFMEYPMMITVASVYGTPSGFRGSQSLAIHEFVHMYFMGMLANNEKEEAWLDEGFVTFYEDEILDHVYGEKCSFFDFGIVKTGNAQKSRQEYTTLPSPDFEIIAKPGWKNKGYYKSLTYGKMATVLRTFKNMIGDELFERLIKYHFDTNKFTHPKEADWLSSVEAVVGLDINGLDVMDYWNTALHQTDYVDYELESLSYSVSHSLVKVRNNGSFAIPTTVQVTYEDGHSESIDWDGADTHTITLGREHGKVVSAYIDPDHSVLLDLNYVNNSKAADPNSAAASTYANLSGGLGQALFYFLSFLF